MAEDRSQMIEALKGQGYENIYERDGKLFVAVSGQDGGISEVIPADQALQTSAPPLNAPSAKGGQGGRGAQQRASRKYRKTMDQILSEDDILREQRRNASQMPLFGLKDLPIPNAILPDDANYGSFMTYAGREADKLGAGIADIADIGRGMFGEDIITNMQRRKAREKEQQEKDKAFKALEMEATAGSGIGSMLPYMVTGAAAPLSTKIAGKALDTAGAGIRRGASAAGRGAAAGGRTIGSRVAEQYRKIEPHVPESIDAALKTGIGKVSDKYKREIADPLARAGRRRATRHPVENQFRRAPLKEALGAAGLGAVESGVHYDDTIGQGAISSLLGHATGAKFKNQLSQAPNLNSAAENEILAKWTEQYGYRPTPGMETGIPEVQKMVADARYDQKYASGVRQIDNANLDAISRVAAEASGMDSKTLRNITPAEMEAHVKSLKQRYESLEDQTSGIPDQDVLDTVLGAIDEYPTSSQNKIMNFIERIEGGYSGKDYKKIRQELKTAYNNARQGNRDEQDAYKALLDEMDESIQRGLSDDLGPVLLQEWRDLNEHYAMTKFMLNNGLDASGRVDAKKIAQSLMSTDAERLLTGRGGKIGKFHDIARLSAIEQKQYKGGIGQSAIEPGDAKPGGILMTPAAGDMGPISAAKFKAAFDWQYPNKYGYLGLPREGIMSAERLGSAYQQGTDMYTELPDKARTYVEKAKNSMWGLLNQQVQ